MSGWVGWGAGGAADWTWPLGAAVCRELQIDFRPAGDVTGQKMWVLLPEMEKTPRA